MFEPKLYTTSLSLCRRETTSVRVRVVCIAKELTANTRRMWLLLALAAKHPSPQGVARAPSANGPDSYSATCSHRRWPQSKYPMDQCAHSHARAPWQDEQMVREAAPS
eukprot:scaffold31147_cov42-Phaeocystis_antarctica.AAC.1